MLSKLALAFLIVLPVTIRDISPLNKIINGTGKSSFDLTLADHHKFNQAVTPFWETNKKNNTVDTAALKQSNWYADVIKNIEAGEYEIKKDDKSGLFCAPNRKQNLKAFYTSDQFTLTPRNDSADKWKLKLLLKGIYAGKNKLYAPVHNPVVTQNGKSIQFNNNNQFVTEYVNNKEGVRQNFIINRQPAGNPEKLSVHLEANKGWFVNRANAKEIHFAKAAGKGYNKKLTYNDLKVWDANNNELEASFTVNKNKISIDVVTKNAVFPITIDPLSTTAAITLEGNQPNAQMGTSVSSAGDVNGDGFSDVIVGAPYYDHPEGDEGAAFVYYGSLTGISTVAADTLEANQAGALFGRSVAGAGDVNGDGYSDVIVGAPLYDHPEVDEGAAFVYHGSPTGINTTVATILESNQVNAQFGWFVAGAGNVNGDRYSDVIVGAYLFDNGETDEGAAFVYHGSVSGISTTIAAMMESNQPNAFFGRAVAGAGDVNGDGYSDVIVGCWAYDNGQTDEGRAYVYHGSAAGIITTANAIVESNQNLAGLGISVASAGDMNGDGYSDVIVGVYLYDHGEFEEGIAYIYYGSSTGINTATPAMVESNQVSSRFGASVACAGDVNGDGYSDVIIGAYFYDHGQTDEGTAFVYLGSATGIKTTYAAIVESNQSDCLFGISVASAGDVNGDGYSDVIVGAWLYDAGQTDEGAAFVYHGSSNGLSAIQTRILSPDNQSLANIGWLVASAGDVNSDGYSDVIVAAPNYDDVSNTDEGRAWVYYGHANGLSATPDVILDDANQDNALFGYSVASAGDVNGDGFGDVVVGAIFYDGGNADEGRAWVYYGSAAGLIATPIRILDDANQNDAWFGSSVASAGDVNGDGYGDVIVSARKYAGSGAAFVYYGHNTTGLSIPPDRILNGENQAGAQFGVYVACAGDVNGDGYSDVVVGAWLYDGSVGIDEGRAYVYNGGGTGLSTTPDRILYSLQAGSVFGVRVAGAGDVNGDGFGDVLVTGMYYDGGKGRGWVYYGHAGTGLSPTPDVILDNTAGGGADLMGYGASGAGDVNGDGYSDVIVGVPQHTVTFTEDGEAFLYYGSVAGLSATPSLIIHDATEAEEFFGGSVAGAGDINGDGYSDVIVGATHGSYPTTFGGRAYVHNGNDSISNKRNNLRLYNADLTTPINSSNFLFGNFGAGLFAKSFLGRDSAKLVWETRLNYNAYSGTPITNSTFFTAQQSTYTDLGLAGVELKNIIDKLLASGRYTRVRARVKYNPVKAITGQVYGPWRNVSAVIDGNSLGALPIELISFKAAWLQKGKTAKINFTTDKETGICCFDIEKSMDGFNFTTIGTVAAKNSSSIQSYSFIDNAATGKKLFYRLKIKGLAGQKEYSNIQQLQNNTATEILVFPNPTTDVLQLLLNGDYSKMNVQIVNSAGQIVKQLNNLAVSNQTLTIPVKNLAAGNYWLRLQTGANMQVLQFVKQ